MTNPTIGPSPRYATQLSFLDTVTEVYVAELGAKSQQLEVWLYDRGRKSILLGKAKILLSDLVYGDAFGSATRGPKVKHELDILPNPDLLTRMHKSR